MYTYASAWSIWFQHAKPQWYSWPELPNSRMLKHNCGPWKWNHRMKNQNYPRNIVCIKTSCHSFGFACLSHGQRWEHHNVKKCCISRINFYSHTMSAWQVIFAYKKYIPCMLNRLSLHDGGCEIYCQPPKPRKLLILPGRKHSLLPGWMVMMWCMVFRHEMCLERRRCWGMASFYIACYKKNICTHGSIDIVRLKMLRSPTLDPNVDLQTPQRPHLWSRWHRRSVFVGLRPNPFNLRVGIIMHELDKHQLSKFQKWILVLVPWDFLYGVTGPNCINHNSWFG